MVDGVEMRLTKACLDDFWSRVDNFFLYQECQEIAH